MHSKNTRLGLVLFAVYLLLYGGFVAAAAVAPGVMEMTPLAGLNLAVLYGFGLIVAALVLAIAYGLLATGGDSAAKAEDGPDRGEGHR